jgi:predicted restriction endonuclease
MEQDERVHVFERLHRDPARYRYHGRWWVLEAGETHTGDGHRTLIRFVVSKYRGWRTPEGVAEDPAPDTKAPPPETETQVVRRVRDSAKARELKEAHDHRCQVCGGTRRLDDERRYAEVHHLHPLGDEGPDVTGNMLVLCPDHHVDFDYGVAAVEPSDGETVVHDFEDDVDGRILRTIDSHQVKSQYLEYHLKQIYRS